MHNSKYLVLWNVSSLLYDSIYNFNHSKVPAYLNIVDIAGLVKGAHEGQGLGNAFLSHIRSVDAIFHLCRKYNT